MGIKDTCTLIPMRLFKKKTMKFSYYNIVIPYKNDDYLLFNTANGAFARVAPSCYKIDNDKLINEGFVIDSDSDELLLLKYRYLSCLYKCSNIHLTIATTMNCNFACPYCFEAGHQHGENMNDQVIDAINKYLAAKRNKPISITWFGGEPLLNWHAIDKISSFLVDNEMQFNANIVTNGSLLSLSYIKKLDNYKIKSIQITLDGTKEIHNSKRFYKSRKGTYDTIIDNIHKVLDNSLCEVVLRVNLDKTNIENFKSLKNEIYNEYGLYIKNYRLRLWPNYIRNRTSFEGCSNCLTPVEFYDFEAGESNYCPKFPMLIGPCPLRSLSSMCIGPDGNIYKCMEHIGNHKNCVGNILNAQFDLYKQADYALNALPFENEMCRDCKILPICGGGCSIDARKNVLEKQNINLCSVEKDKLNEILINYYEKFYA